MSAPRGWFTIGLLAGALALAGCGSRTPEPVAHEEHGTPDAHGDAHEEHGTPDAHGDAHEEHGSPDAHDEAERVTLTPAAVHAGDLAWAPAGPRAIAVAVAAPGEVRLDAERVVQVRPRFAGVVHALPRRLGDRVRAGDLVAVLQSNESLAEYEVRAPLAGTVIARDVAVGQTVDAGDVLMTVADLGAVWVDFALAPRAADRVRAGQSAVVRAVGDSSLRAEGRVDYVGPLLEQDTRVSHGRVVLANRDGRWSPGRFVDVSVTVERARAAVAVPEDALVRMAEGPAVFVAAGGTFTLRAVRPGRSDGAWTEIVDGLAAGDSVVTRNAYLLKAELTKGEAGHDH